jgi:hypothetical protein
METIVRDVTDAGLLELMPYLLGEHPRNSVVLLAFNGNRTHGAVRLDLPKPAARSALVYKRLSRVGMGMLGKLPSADGVTVFVVTDDAFGATGTPPHSELVAELRRTIIHSQLTLKGVLCRARDGWAPYFDPDVPRGGYSLADLADTNIAAQLPAELRRIFDSPFVASRIPDAIKDMRAHVMTVFERVRREIDLREQDVAASPNPHSSIIRVLSETALDFGATEFRQFAGLFLLAAQNAVTSDLMLLQWATGEHTGLRLWEELVLSEPDWFRPQIHELIYGLARRPDPERLEHAVKFVVQLVACADEAVRPAPLYMLAWLHWASGRGFMASLCLAEAFAIEPNFHRAAELDWMLNHRVLPAWSYDTDEFDEYDESDLDEDQPDDDECDSGGDSVHFHHDDRNEEEGPQVEDRVNGDGEQY